jgi:hypothetical protein
MTSCTTTPAVPPINSDGKMDPPTRPLPWLTAKLSMLPDARGGEQARAEVPGAADHGLELVAAALHTVDAGEME